VADTIRCPHCDLNQFETKDGKCRRCRRFFVEPVPLPVPLLPDPSHKRQHGTAITWQLPIAFRIVRGASGLSQSDLGKVATVTRQYISKIERVEGGVVPTLNQFFRICEALQINPYGLLLMAEAIK
jgi:DNA-binding XRE family transcriptional regulator